MKNYHNTGGKAGFFEGWYFKHQKGDRFIMLIPGVCVKAAPIGRIKYAFIQIITNEKVCCINYPMSDCSIAADKLYIKIGDNIFSRNGIRLNILSGDIRIKGGVRYGSLSPIRYPVMGIFRFVPRMECNHEIISMHHELYGRLTVNGEAWIFDEGNGYLEKDWGHSFPKSYIWLQCNSFSGAKCAVTVSIARIPFFGSSFQGCIGIIHYGGMEYRFASYLGVKIITYGTREIQLRQGRYLFRVKFGNDTGLPEEDVTPGKGGLYYQLLAPSRGAMSRMIYEQNFCTAHFELFEGSRLVFDLTSDKTSLEIAR